MISGGQTGSTLVGMCLFLLTSMLGGLFMMYMTHHAVLYSTAANRRAAILHEASIDTQLLNQISINNALMIVSISEAMAKYAESLHAGLGYQITIPFWRSGSYGSSPAAFAEPRLTEQESVKAYFAAASRDLSEALTLAYRLKNNSQAAVQMLEARWGASTSHLSKGSNHFGESSFEQLLCISLANTAAMPKSKLVVSLELSTLQKQVFENCVIKIGGIVVFNPKELIQTAKLSPANEFGLILLKKRDKLCISAAAKKEEWQQSPIWVLFKWKHFLKLEEHRVALLHPRLVGNENDLRSKKFQTVDSFYHAYCNTQSKPPDLQPLLEPNWVPVYLTEGLGQ